MSEAFIERSVMVRRAENGWIVFEFVGGTVVAERIHLALDSALADMAEVVQAIERLRAMP
jgi:hypothetical protein